MPGTTSVYLPLNTWVHVQAYTNASFNQRVTITQENGTVTTLVGTGEHDAPMPHGNFGLTTPDQSSSPLGYRVTVQIESSDSGGQYQPSQVYSGSCGVMYYSLLMVVSEDYVDEDWNDAVVLFTWWTPPQQRTEADLHKE
jgi:hypothetical protein